MYLQFHKSMFLLKWVPALDVDVKLAPRRDGSGHEGGWDSSTALNMADASLKLRKVLIIVQIQCAS